MQEKLKELLAELTKEIAEKGHPPDPAEQMRKVLDGATEIRARSVYPRLEAPLFGGKQGSFVSVRPVGEEYGNRSFLGIYLGDVRVGTQVRRKPNSTVIEVEGGTGMANPCIWVPDLNQFIYGAESWWGEIESEEQLRQITNDDINNVWYVKALKDLGLGEPNLQPNPTEN